jgi:Tol biopolymer transport system component
VRIRIGLVAVLGAAALVLPAAQGGLYSPPPPDVHPVWSPDASTIAFYRFGVPDQSGVRVVLPDGSGDRRLAGVPSTRFFAFSRDWKQLALVVFQGTTSGDELDVVAPEQGPVRVLATNAFATVDPAFSPDGSRIAYAGRDGIWTIPVNGGLPVRIADEFGKDLAWSPDGTRVAYDVNDAAAPVKIAQADGGGTVPVSTRPSTGPAWSPDGKTLAYFSTEGGARVWTETGGKATSFPIHGWSGPHPLWSFGGTLFYANGGGLNRLDLVSGETNRIGPAGGDVSLAPDGSRYAYTAIGECGDRVGVYVRTVAANGAARRITNDCHVYGTNGPDHLTSSASLYEIVAGRGGNDTIVARGAPYVGDELDGGPGNDFLRGGYWPEVLNGGPGDDTIYAGVNRDTLRGGPGRDSLYGQGGTDRIYARDSARDVGDCGRNTGKTNTTPERDTAYVDRLDVVKNCERVFRSR